MNFRQWLWKQRKRTGPIGDLSRDTFASDGIPLPRPLTPESLFDHMKKHYDPSDGVWEAWTESWWEWNADRMAEFLEEVGMYDAEGGRNDD